MSRSRWCRRLASSTPPSVRRAWSRRRTSSRSRARPRWAAPGRCGRSMPSPLGVMVDLGRDHSGRLGRGLAERRVGQHREHVRQRCVVARSRGGAACPHHAAWPRAGCVGWAHGRRELRVLRRGGRAAHLRQLPAPAPAARRPAPRVRSAGPRRAAVHHDPPGLRALVPAAPARGRGGARRAARTPTSDAERRARPAVVGAAPDEPRARDRAGAGPAGRRAGDDDAAGLPGVPPAAGAGERLPVGAVPRAGVPLRRQGRRATSTGSRA